MSSPGAITIDGQSQYDHFEHIAQQSRFLPPPVGLPPLSDWLTAVQTVTPVYPTQELLTTGEDEEQPEAEEQEDNIPRIYYRHVDPLVYPADTAPFPDPALFEIQLLEYLSNLSDRKKEKALISRDTYEKIQRVRKNKDNTRIETAQFRFWCRKQFNCDAETGWEVYHQSRRICVKEDIYAALCQAHADCNHGGRDKTSAKVREQYSYIPKDLIARFVKICRTCEHRREAGRMTAAEVADLAAGGDMNYSPVRQSNTNSSRPNIQVIGSSIGRRAPVQTSPSIYTVPYLQHLHSDEADDEDDEEMRAQAFAVGHRQSLESDNSGASAPITPLDAHFPTTNAYFHHRPSLVDTSQLYVFTDNAMSNSKDEGNPNLLGYREDRLSAPPMQYRSYSVASTSTSPLPSPTGTNLSFEAPSMCGTVSGQSVRSEMAQQMGNLALHPLLRPRSAFEEMEEPYNFDLNGEAVIMDARDIRHWQSQHIGSGYIASPSPFDFYNPPTSHYAVSPAESLSLFEQQQQDALAMLQRQQQQQGHSEMSAKDMYLPSSTQVVNVDECDTSEFINNDSDTQDI